MKNAMERKAERDRRARRSLGCGLGCFFLLAFVLGAGVEKLDTLAFDPPYHDRLCLLRDFQQSHPNVRLGLVLGSSRVDMGFMPEILPETRDAAGRRVQFFNFCHYGSGPLMQWLFVQRLREEGIHPEWVILEVMPPYLANENNHFFMGVVAGREMPRLLPYIPIYQMAQYGWKRRGELIPRYCHSELLNRTGIDLGGPHLLKAPERLYLGGHADLPKELDEEKRRAKGSGQSNLYQRDLKNFRVSARSDRALRDTVAVCQRDGIDVTLLLTPEGPAFQSVYRPGSQEVLLGYLRDLEQQNGVRIVNARNWLAEEDFSDSHHPTLPGAREFTQRLHEELLRHLAEQPAR